MKTTYGLLILCFLIAPNAKTLTMFQSLKNNKTEYSDNELTALNNLAQFLYYHVKRLDASQAEQALWPSGIKADVRTPEGLRTFATQFTAQSQAREAEKRAAIKAGWDAAQAAKQAKSATAQAWSQTGNVAEHIEQAAQNAWTRARATRQRGQTSLGAEQAVRDVYSKEYTDLYGYLAGLAKALPNSHILEITIPPDNGKSLPMVDDKASEQSFYKKN